MQNLWILLLLLMASSNLRAGSVYRSFGRTINEKEYEIVWKNTYSQTRNRWDVNGKGVTLEQGESYVVLDTEFSFFYSFIQDLQFETGVRARRVNSRRWDGNETQSVSNSAIESGYVSSMFSFKPVGNTLFSIEGTYRQFTYHNPTFRAATPDEFVVMGDGGRSIQFGTSLSYYHSNDWISSFKVIYRNPSTDLSNEVNIFYEGASLMKGSGLYWGVDYLHSLKQDEYDTSIPYTTATNNKPEIGRGAGYRYNSVNREWFKVYAGVNFNMSAKTHLRVASSYAINGKSTDQDWTTSLSLVISPVSTTLRQKRDKVFKEYTVEADIIKVSGSGKFIVINAGLEDGVRKGMVFDIFDFDFEGGNQLLAKAKAYRVNASESILVLTDKFRRIRINKKHVARGR
jgi:hypothetical protein